MGNPYRADVLLMYLGKGQEYISKIHQRPI